MDRAPESDGGWDRPDDTVMLVERLAAAVHAAAAASDDALEAAQLLVRQTAVAFRATGAMLAIVDDAGTPVPVVIHGDGRTGDGAAALPLEWLLPLAAAALTGESLFLEDRIDGAARFAEWDTFEATAAAAALPLVARGRIVGAVALVFDAPRTFASLARRYLQLVADLCALSVGGTAEQVARLTPASGTRQAVDDADAEIALLDTNGVIVAVNDAWLDFGRHHGGDPARCGVGASYLAVCDAAAGDIGAAVIGAAIRAALAGTPMAGPVIIPCHDVHEDRWYDVLVSTRWSDVEPREVVGASVVFTRSFPVARRDGA